MNFSLKNFVVFLVLIIAFSGCIGSGSNGPGLISLGKELSANDFWGRTCSASLSEDWSLEGDNSSAFNGNLRAVLVAEENLGHSLKSKVLLLALESGAEDILSSQPKTIDGKDFFVVNFRKTLPDGEKSYSIFGFQKKDTFCMIAFSAPVVQQNSAEFDKIAVSLDSSNAMDFGKRTMRYNTQFGQVEFATKQNPKIFKLGETFDYSALQESDYFLGRVGNVKGNFEFKLNTDSQIPLVNFPDSLKDYITQSMSGNAAIVSFDFSQMPDYFQEMDIFSIVVEKGLSFKASAKEEKILEFDNTSLYDLKLQGNDLFVNSSFVVNSKDPVNYWTLNWNLPDNSEIISIKDSLREITEYSLDGNSLQFTTTFGSPRIKDQIIMQYLVKGAVKEKYSGLKQLEVPFSASNEEKTKIELELPNLLSYYSTFGFTSNFSNGKYVLSGQGPSYLNVFFSDKQSPYKHYVLFGNDKFDVSKEDNLYQEVEKIVGTKIPFSKFPVLVLSASDYEKETEMTNPGIYRNGLIILQEDSFKEEFQNNKINTSLLHESGHGLTEQVLKWAKHEDALRWFNEGVSTYIEFVIDYTQDRRYPNLFAEDKTYTEGNTTITLPSAASEDSLWQYFQTNDDYMEQWVYSDEDKLNFGYSFGQLMIRNYVLENGFDSLSGLYSKLFEQKDEIETVQEANKLVLDLMGLTELKPCNFPNKQEFQNCIAKANQMQPRIPN
ncbi:MAG: hypothetical protein Q7K42_06425 [Candidatus Diapherotrites archaeon]|nr:hypothetical protein [Candidatus Diapherotrites archaeon]